VSGATRIAAVRAEEETVATTISWDTLRQLAEFRARQGCAISLYVNLDPSLTPTAGDAKTRINSLVDGLRAHYAQQNGLTHDQREALRGDTERIRRWFETDFDRDGARALGIFCARLENLWRTIALPEAVEDSVHLGRELLLTPLVPLVGRSDGAMVAVVSREQGRLYRLEAGRLNEVADLTEEQPGQHDQGGWSQARFQRHIEKLVTEHVKSVAGEISASAARAGGSARDRLSPGDAR